jgi:hypothetical protein
LRHSTGADLVAVEAVEDAAGLLGVDEVGVDSRVVLAARWMAPW